MTPMNPNRNFSPAQKTDDQIAKDKEIAEAKERAPQRLGMANMVPRTSNRDALLARRDAQQAAREQRQNSVRDRIAERRTPVSQIDKPLGPGGPQFPQQLDLRGKAKLDADAAAQNSQMLQQQQMADLMAKAKAAQNPQMMQDILTKMNMQQAGQGGTNPYAGSTVPGMVDPNSVAMPYYGSNPAQFDLAKLQELMGGDMPPDLPIRRYDPSNPGAFDPAKLQEIMKGGGFPGQPVMGGGPLVQQPPMGAMGGFPGQPVMGGGPQVSRPLGGYPGQPVMGGYPQVQQPAGGGFGFGPGVDNFGGPQVQQPAGGGFGKPVGAFGNSGSQSAFGGQPTAGFGGSGLAALLGRK